MIGGAEKVAGKVINDPGLQERGVKRQVRAYRSLPSV